MDTRRLAARAGTGRPGSTNPLLVLAGMALVGLLAACSAQAASSNGVVTLASAAPGGSAAPSASESSVRSTLSSRRMAKQRASTCIGLAYTGTPVR